MKKSLVGTALALFAVAPAMAWADCDFHDKASMASKSTDKAELAQQQATIPGTPPSGQNGWRRRGSPATDGDPRDSPVTRPNRTGNHRPAPHLHD